MHTSIFLSFCLFVFPFSFYASSITRLWPQVYPAICWINILNCVVHSIACRHNFLVDIFAMVYITSSTRCLLSAAWRCSNLSTHAILCNVPLQLHAIFSIDHVVVLSEPKLKRNFRSRNLKMAPNEYNYSAMNTSTNSRTSKYLRILEYSDLHWYSVPQAMCSIITLRCN
jgi:hypothetical protein